MNIGVRGLECQRGQTLVLFTLMIVALFGFLALTIDLGLLFGQRRFGQNGSDAAALAASRMLASNVIPLNAQGTAVSFGVSDVAVYKVVRQYAGLNPNILNSSDPNYYKPTGMNQNPGLNDRNLLAVSLEYWTGPSDGWCYSPAGPEPPRVPAVPECILYNGTPPLPGSGTYKIRVTVSSTTDSFFAEAIGSGNVGASIPQTDSSKPACIRPRPAGGSLDDGMLTCAQAVAAVKGSSTYITQNGVIPVTTGDCQLTPDPNNVLYQLWGASGKQCGVNPGSWAFTLDFTPETKWCDQASGGSGSNPDYQYRSLLPAASQVASGTCVGRPVDSSWNRNGYQPDPNYAGTGVQDADVQYWLARGFWGQIAVDNHMTTYVSANPAQTGNQGDNISTAVYCGPSATAYGCSDPKSVTGTYFFAKDQPGYYDICRDDIGAAYGVGCRDATVAVWRNAQEVQGGNIDTATQWKPANSAPQRVQVARLLNFRIYCRHKADNPNDVCNSAPNNVPGVQSASNATIWGRFVAPFVPDCPTCTDGPSLLANTATLEE